MDSSKNIFIVGNTQGNLESETSNGNNDAFIYKLNSNGEKLWFKLFGTSEYDSCQSITLNDSLNPVIGCQTVSANTKIGELMHGGLKSRQTNLTLKF